jgi:hypothetical protein
LGNGLSGRRQGFARVNSLFVGLIAGAIGMGYFIYGKRQLKIVPMVAGVLLCIYPYFLDSLLWLSLVGLILIAAPFLIDY